MTTSTPSNSALIMQQKALSHWDLVNRLARRRFHKEELAEEAALYVMDTLAKEDWKRLRQFSGKSKFSTYFSSVSFRLLEDFARARFGRVTPPKWIKNMGGIWLSLFRILCLERFSFADALNIAETKYQEIRPQRIEQVAEKILGEIPQCGKLQQEQSFEEEQLIDENLDHTLKSSSQTPEAKQQRLILEAIGQEIFGNYIDNKSNQDLALTKILKHKIALQKEEILLLKLCYIEGLSATKAGQVLGINRFQAHGRLRRLLARIKKHFIETGCAEELHALLR